MPIRSAYACAIGRARFDLFRKLVCTPVTRQDVQLLDNMHAAWALCALHKQAIWRQRAVIAYTANIWLNLAQMVERGDLVTLAAVQKT